MPERPRTKLDHILQVEVVDAGDALVVVPIGEIDVATAPLVLEPVRAALRDGTRDICLDLSACSHLDSTGLAALINIRRYTIRALGSLVLVVPAGRLDELLVFAGLERYFSIARTRDDALRRLAS